MATAQSQEPSWQCDKSLAECLNHLFTSGIACDVTFLLGENKYRIPAHKTVLISRSPVFYAMFEGNLAEKGEIAIPDIEQEVFTLFLRYLYTDTIELTVNTATSVLSAARKYMVDHLVTKCETFLKSSLTTENVCLLLEQAHIYTEESVKEDCVNMIARSPEEVLKSTSFVDLCGVCVKSITESDDLAVEESVVYEAVMRWSEAECGRQGLEVTDTNRRQVLGDIIYTVRFPIIDAKYLSQHIMTTDVLTTEQLVSVMRFQQDNKAYPCTEFSVNQRNVGKPVITMFETYHNSNPYPAELPDTNAYYRTAPNTGYYQRQPNVPQIHPKLFKTNRNYENAPMDMYRPTSPDDFMCANRQEDNTFQRIPSRQGGPRHHRSNVILPPGFGITNDLRPPQAEI